MTEGLLYCKNDLFAAAAKDDKQRPFGGWSAQQTDWVIVWGRHTEWSTSARQQFSHSECFSSALHRELKLFTLLMCQWWASHKPLWKSVPCSPLQLSVAVTVSALPPCYISNPNLSVQKEQTNRKQPWWNSAPRWNLGNSLGFEMNTFLKRNYRSQGSLNFSRLISSQFSRLQFLLELTIYNEPINEVIPWTISVQIKIWKHNQMMVI